jgi:hypothetical protein
MLVQSSFQESIMTATHTREELDHALEILKRVGKRMGVLA